ncbi:unnamed protein product, partial [Urochloa humidicola]
ARRRLGGGRRRVVRGIAGARARHPRSLLAASPPAAVLTRRNWGRSCIWHRCPCAGSLRRARAGLRGRRRAGHVPRAAAVPGRLHAPLTAGRQPAPILLHSSLSSPHQNQQSSPFSLTCPLQNPAVRHGAVDPSPHRAGRTPVAQIRRKPALGRGAACGASPRSAVMEQPDAPRPSHICSCFSVVAGDTTLLCIAMNVIPTSLSCSGISSLTALLFLSRTTARRKPLFSAAPSICSAVQQNPIADEEASCITDPLDKVQQMT